MTSVSTIPTVAIKPCTRNDLMQGMQCLDTTSSSRIPVLMELVGALSRATDPREVQFVFGQGFTQLYGVRGYISLSTRNLPPGQYRVTRMLLKDADQLIRNTDPWSVISTLPVHRGGILGELIRSAYPEVIHHLNIKDDPVLGDVLAPYGSL